jgi:hypothetical protein
MLRAYDLKSGLLLLDDRSHRGDRSWAADIALRGKRVFVVGATNVRGLPSSDFLVRAYDAKAIK